MITGELKNKIDQLWEMLWTEGNANPLTNMTGSRLGRPLFGL